MSASPRNVSLRAGAIITGLFVIAALLAHFWTPYDPRALAIIQKLQPPNAHHWFGTDQLGRDVLSLIMVGAQTSVGVALLSVVIGLFVGVPLGLLAAARGGAIDELLMRGNDVIFAFPSLLLAILITAVLGPGAVNAIIAIGIFNIPVFARVTRAGALQLWTRDYALAARVAGKGPLRISWEHMLPNLLAVLAVQGAIQFSLGVIAEAGLSYVGLSAQPPTPSWGRMLNEAQTLTALAPFLALFPGCAVLLFVLGLNLLGEGLRRRAERPT
ncbi:MAG: peptide/nickel transport system permease protein [Gammaproteobacteria bacterium]|jgi:peptide/nickel transport system permease protein|nr:peptide/nickel transport system permease protein [Gammaproteobacteria bacterium]